MSTSLAETPVSEETRLMLEELAQLENTSMQDALARAVKEHWGRRIIEASNDAYRALQADPQAWQALHEERMAWDTTLIDGLN